MLKKEFFQKMKKLLPINFNSIHSAHHYLALSLNSWNTITEHQEIRLKKLFYDSRGLLCARWSVVYKTMLPTQFNDLLLPKLLLEDILDIIMVSQKQKLQGDEKTTIVLEEKLYNFYIEYRQLSLQQLNSLSYNYPGNMVLNQLFPKE